MRIIEFDLHDSNKGVMKSDDPNLIMLIREKLSVANKNARFIKNYTGRSYERIYCITKGGKFDIGLFKTIKDAINREDIPVQFKYTDKFIKECLPQFDYSENNLSELDLIPYDYQETSVKRMLKFGRGIILVGTGGGKTFIMSLMTKTIMDNENSKRFLIIVPTIQLVEQTYSDFIDYGFNSSIISRWSGEYDFQNTQIIVASSSILQSKSSDLSFLENIDVLMVDEVHILKKNNLINKVIDKIPSINRFGFTGTMPEEIEDQWNVIGKIGPILYEKNSDSLRDDKFISQVQIDVIRINYNFKTISELHKELENTVNKYDCELQFMINNQFRNDLIIKTAMVSRGNTLIMVDRIEHGKNLEKLLKKKSKKKIFFIKGDVKVDKREEVRQIMEDNTDIICIAISKIFSTGINIKNIHNILFATAGKAKVKLIQSIGRGLRLHKSKEILIVYDFADNLHYSNKHLARRERLYMSEKLNYEIRNVREPTKGDKKEKALC